MAFSDTLAKLAQFVTAGLFSPTKPIEQYKPAQVQRAVSTIERTGKYDRGHSHTPEHGRVSAPQPVGKADSYTTKSSQQADRLIAAAAANGQRVSISVTDSRNPTRPITVYENARGGRQANGIDARWLRDGTVGRRKVGYRAKGQNLKTYLEKTRFSRRTKAGNTVGYRPKGITSIQITIYPKS